MKGTTSWVTFLLPAQTAARVELLLSSTSGEDKRQMRPFLHVIIIIIVIIVVVTKTLEFNQL